MNKTTCINDTYKPDQLEFWKLHKVTHPVKDEHYTIRDVIRHTTGDLGIRIYEIINPMVPIKHPVLGVVMMEPSFHYARFTDENGVVLSYEDVARMAKEVGTVVEALS